MRIRRKAWARPELEACPFFIQNPKEWKGKWQETFKTKQPLYIELGCGKGPFIAQMAKKHPNKNFIAIDIKSDVLGYARRNIVEVSEKEVENVKLVAYDIEQILDIFSEQDKVERIYINFCNPWPRPKHKKRRLTHTRQLEKYRTFLKEEGEIYFKTDDDLLFKDSIQYLEESNFTIEKITYDAHQEKIGNEVMTEHEKMFSERGIKIKSLIAKKRNNDY